MTTTVLSSHGDQQFTIDGGFAGDLDALAADLDADWCAPGSLFPATRQRLLRLPDDTARWVDVQSGTITFTRDGGTPRCTWIPDARS